MWWIEMNGNEMTRNFFIGNDEIDYPKKKLTFSLEMASKSTILKEVLWPRSYSLTWSKICVVVNFLFFRFHTDSISRKKICVCSMENVQLIYKISWNQIIAHAYHLIFCEDSYCPLKSNSAMHSLISRNICKDWFERCQYII